MTKEKFLFYLERGRGECFEALKNDPEKYRPEVMYACTKCTAYDPQCEGTRSVYVYELIHCYEDISPFVQAACQSLKDTDTESESFAGDWEVCFLCELLYWFTLDGNETAHTALNAEYARLYDILEHKKAPERGIYHTRDVFEFLCMIIWNKKAARVRIARDIGALYRANADIDRWGFDWVFSAVTEKQEKEITRFSETDENICFFLQKIKENRKSWGIELSKNEKRNTKRIPRYRVSDELLNKNADELDKFVRSVSVENAEDPLWHGVFMDTGIMFEQGEKVKFETLEYIYENTFCSCCRENVMELLIKHRHFDRKTAFAALKDSNADIRRRAAKWLKRRKIL